MKRILCFLFVVTMSLSLFVGCGTQAAQPEEPLSFADIYYDYSNWDFLTAEHEIVTYEQPDTDKIPLVIGLAGSNLSEPLIAAFARQHPECQVVVTDITCGENSEALVDALDNGRTPDILFVSTNSSLENADQYFTDMSNNPVCQKYYTSALQQFDMNGKVYYLPGPSSSFGIIYNKSMFADHGWQVPKTFDEFLMLCQQIETETDGAVDAFNPNAKYALWLSNILLTPSYADLLQTPQDYRWLQDFLVGKATFSGHMEPLFENAKALGAAGGLTDADWSQSATALHNDFLAGKIAMINHTWSAAYSNSTQYDFDIFPTPGKVEGADFIINLPTYAVAVPKPTHPLSKEKQALIDEMVTFVSSGHGQSLLLGGVGLVPSVTELPLNKDIAFPLLQNALESGRVYAQQSFGISGRNTDIPNLVSAQARAVLQGEQTPAGACVAVDHYVADYFAGRITPITAKTIGNVAESFTVLKTSQLLCDVFQEKTGADVAIVMHNVPNRGNLMPIYTGELNAQDITNLKPRALSGDSALVKLKMTGRELLECLNHPYNSVTNGDYNAVYAFSGLQATVRPFAPMGEKYSSVTLSDGTALEEDKVYTVATWEGMVWDRYANQVADTYDGTFQEIFTEYLTAHTPLSPTDSDRMTLRWD